MDQRLEVFVSFYEKHCLPHFLNCVCGLKPIVGLRQKVVPLAEGKVLEAGIGGALNLPFYDPDKVDLVWGLEPSEGMLAEGGNHGRRFSVERVGALGQGLANLASKMITKAGQGMMVQVSACAQSSASSFPRIFMGHRISGPQ